MQIRIKVHMEDAWYVNTHLLLMASNRNSLRKLTWKGVYFTNSKGILQDVSLLQQSFEMLCFPPPSLSLSHHHSNISAAILKWIQCLSLFTWPSESCTCSKTTRALADVTELVRSRAENWTCSSRSWVQCSSSNATLPLSPSLGPYSVPGSCPSLSHTLGHSRTWGQTTPSQPGCLRAFPVPDLHLYLCLALPT